MKIFIVGSGKLANAVLSAELSFDSCEILKWEPSNGSLNEKAIVVHAGSGRELQACLDFCTRTNSTFIELSTGLVTETLIPDFPMILCPNTSILLLKTLNMLKHYGHYFKNDKISITESHQSSKTSAPGTAISFADSLGFPADHIRSVRDAETQRDEIGIPEEFLGRHAYHKIVIEDGLDEVVIETKVLGHQSYVNGVRKILEVVLKHPLENKKYSVLDLIDNNWL